MLAGRVRMGQSWNGAGAAGAAGGLVRPAQRALAVPHVSGRDLRGVDWRALRAAGARACVFDKDNTLTDPYALELRPEVAGAFAECLEAFGARNVALVSNSAGLAEYDPEGKEADRVERELGCPVLRHALKKPEIEPEALTRHFGCATEEMVMVGDRFLTDVMYGNRMGMLTVKVEAFTGSGERATVRAARWAETRLVGFWMGSLGTQPPAHAFFSHPAAEHSFLKKS